MEKLYVDNEVFFFFEISEMLAHDLRYTDDTDTIAVTVMDNTRAVTAHKDLNIVCWDIEQGLRLKFTFSVNCSSFEVT